MLKNAYNIVRALYTNINKNTIFYQIFPFIIETNRVQDSGTVYEYP